MNNRIIVEPELINAVKQHLNALKWNEMNCHRMGTIESFDPVSCTATVSLFDKMLCYKVDGTVDNIQDIAPIVKCPVYRTYGFNSPINRGDECLVLFNDRDITSWRDNGIWSPPKMPRCHDFTDAIVIVGWHNAIKQLPYYNPSAVGIYKDGAIVEVSDKVQISNEAQNLKTILTNLTNTLKSAKVLNPITGTYDLTFDPATISSLSIIADNLNALLL